LPFGSVRKSDGFGDSAARTVRRCGSDFRMVRRRFGTGPELAPALCERRAGRAARATHKP
jgi:hypothetical protein